MDISQYIRQVPDFPKPGINFYDITTLLNEPSAFRWTINTLATPYDHKEINKVVAIESRGFVFGAPLALRFDAGLVLVRKPNKLPYKTYSHTYELEYGEDTVEIHQDAIEEGDKVVIIDDLLATGGTLAATIELVKKFNCTIVGVSCVIELTFLNGRQKLQSYPFHTLVQYSE